MKVTRLRQFSTKTPNKKAHIYSDCPPHFTDIYVLYKSGKFHTSFLTAK